MQAVGQNNNIQQQRPILPSACCCHATQNMQNQAQTVPQAQAQAQIQAQASAPASVPTQCCQTQAAATTVTTNPQQNMPAVQNYPAGYVPPQNMYPQYLPQAQNLQVQPSANGVNIQIFNPSVGTPGAAPTYNVNAPCYPSGYYTNSVGSDGKMHPNNSGVGQQGNNTNNGSVDGNVNTGTNNGIIGNNNNTNSNNVTTNNNTTTVEHTQKKTEKRKIVELTDDYIKNLETYLDSQDKQVRLNAAKEVYARLEEDDSRWDDKALNALINKMLQDPSREIRFIALTALDGRICKGDDYTVGVLQRMQANNNDPLNQEAADANSILLKMSGRQVEKEFEVKDKKDKKANEISDKFKPEGAKL